MDQDPHNQQLQQLAHSNHPQQQSHSQQPHPHQHRQHPSQSQLLPQLQLQLLQQQQRLQHHHHHHQQQQQLDSTPQDVLAEARKNLQFLIDSGLSKDFLHQWVDNDLSLQLSFPCQQQQQQQQPQQQSLAQSFAPAVSPTSSIAPTPLQSPLLAHPTSQPQSHLPSPSHAHMSMLSSPLQQPIPLSPTQLTPAMTLMHTSSGPSGPGTMTTTAPPMTTTITRTTRTTMTTPPLADSHSTMASSTPEAPSGKETTPTIVIKPDPSFEDGPATWATPLPQTQTPVPMPAAQIGSLGSAHDSALNGTADAETSILIPPPMPPLNHRPRISVSSTSSGSSGHASIWSANSAHSAMSWHSASSSRSMAPLPMPPPVTSTSAAPLITNAQSVAANKQNVYWCTSCETSFKRKYDWKRHEDEFHERWRKYPCPEPGCNRSFWGSNSFNQHHKQCHGCKTCPHAEKVVKFLRKRKYWACGFCSALHPARERHVEHVARHFESGLAKGDWMHSRVIYGLLHQPLIHGAWDALVSGKHGDLGDLGARRPQFSWHPNKTGRAQGFLEKENPGQLQDLLEFFSGDEGEAQWIVTMAYDLADVVQTTPTSTASPHPPLPLPPAPPPSCSSATAVQSQQHLTSNAIVPASGPFSQQQDHHQHHHHHQQQQHHLSFPSAPPVPSQTSQQGMMASPISATPSPFTPSPYRSHMFVPSPGFPSVQQPSPDSMTQSPLLPSQAPSHLEKRELPPIPHQPHGPITGSCMMDFEYSAAPVLYDEWESLTTAVMVDASQLQHQHQQQSQQQSHQNQPSNQGPPADWGMSQYFNDS